MMLSQSTRELALRMAIVSIAAWRRSKAYGLPQGVARNRGDALFYLHAYRTGHTL